MPTIAARELTRAKSEALVGPLTVGVGGCTDCAGPATTGSAGCGDCGAGEGGEAGTASALTVAPAPAVYVRALCESSMPAIVRVTPPRVASTTATIRDASFAIPAMTWSRAAKGVVTGALTGTVRALARLAFIAKAMVATTIASHFGI